MIEWGYKAQRLANRALKTVRQGADQAAARHDGRARRSRSRSSTSSTSACRAACRRGPRARCSTSKTAITCPSFAIRATTTSESEAVFYFPGCGSERLFSQVGLATQAMLWHVGVQTVLPPGISVLRIPAARRGRIRQGRENHHRQPRAVPPRRQYLELSRHQDRGGELRHLLRSAAGLRVRGDFPGLQDHRHPRVPHGEGCAARERHRRALHVPRPLPLADEEARPARRWSTR